MNEQDERQWYHSQLGKSDWIAGRLQLLIIGSLQESWSTKSNSIGLERKVENLVLVMVEVDSESTPYMQ